MHVRYKWVIRLNSIAKIADLQVDRLFHNGQSKTPTGVAIQNGLWNPSIGLRTVKPVFCFVCVWTVG